MCCDISNQEMFACGHMLTPEIRGWLLQRFGAGGSHGCGFRRLLSVWSFNYTAFFFVRVILRQTLWSPVGFTSLLVGIDLILVKNFFALFSGCKAECVCHLSETGEIFWGS